jgi:hypothetical protein
VTEEHAPFRYHLEPRGTYLYVKVEGKMTTREQMLAYRSAIASAMTPELGLRAMMDGREAERPLIELRAEMWTWMAETPCLQRIAIVANEERTTARIARTAELNRMKVAGFHTIAEAEAWLLDEFDVRTKK